MEQHIGDNSLKHQKTAFMDLKIYKNNKTAKVKLVYYKKTE